VGGVVGTGDAEVMRRGCPARQGRRQPCSGRLWTTGPIRSCAAGKRGCLWTTRSRPARRSSPSV